MDFGFTEEQDILRRSARSFLEKQCSPEFVRTMWEDPLGYSPDMWMKMSEMGWMGLLIPEQYGGLGLSFVDLGVVLEEMGRVILPAPYFSTVILAGETILHAGREEQKKELLEKIALGEEKMTLALVEETGSYEASGIKLAAKAEGNSFVLTGKKLFVLDAHVADRLIIAARTDQDTNSKNGITLFLVNPKEAGVTINLLPTMDGTRKLSEVNLVNVKVDKTQVLGEVNQGWAALQETLEAARAALCMESVGGAQKILEISVEYAKTRVQFGQPIGSYQAIKHKCAEIMLEVESGKSIAYFASWAIAEDIPEVALVVSMAKAYCGDMYNRASGEAIQILGGIGFTWEHEAHHYFKRARWSQYNFGDSNYHRERVAQCLSL